MTAAKTETPQEVLLRMFDEAAAWPTIRQAIRDVLMPEQVIPGGYRPCPACRAPLAQDDTHWSLFSGPAGGYVCPVPL